MTAKKKIILIISGIVLVFALIIAGVLIWFFSPGIHRLFIFTHIDYTTNGYIITSEGEVIGEATLTVKGNAKEIGENGTSGRQNAIQLELTGYESISKADSAAAYTNSLNGGILEFAVCNTTIDIIKTTDPYEPNDYEFDYHNYYLLLDEQESELLMCRIMTDVDGTSEKAYFIPTDDPDSAYEEIKEILNRAYK